MGLNLKAKQKPFWSLLINAALITGMSLPLSGTAATAPYAVDAESRTVTVSPVKGDASAGINSALAYLINRPDKNNRWTLKFSGGRYILDRHLFADRLENVALVSDRKDPAVLMKSAAFANEYLFYSRYTRNISMSGFQFYGKTTFRDNADPVWGDQGIYFGSSQNVTVDKNRFHNFGNAALRVTTSESDPVIGVNSFNTSVTNNYFSNVYQITTTSNDLVHGASNSFLFQNNNVVNLRGSVKFATRTPATNVKVIGNYIMGSSLDGFEISSYSNLELSYNTLQDISRNAINCYTNDRALPGFAWGDNITIKANNISNAGTGLRFSPNPYSDGTKVTPKNVVIESNTFTNILSTSAPAISMVNGTFNGLVITRNKLNRVASGKYISVAGGSQNVSISSNYVDNKIYTASN